MKLADIAKQLEGIPHMTQRQGEVIYNLILDNDIVNVLELGTAHGKGSCYMAAALDEKGKGLVLTIDNRMALDRKPSVNEMLKTTNLEKYVTPVFANTTYNWELMKLIERQTKNGICEPVFDLCFIDGAHNFEVDCCAFFLVDKLLKPGGLLLFDDLNWSYSQSATLRDADWVKRLSEEERITPHIKKLVDLVVKQHSSYTDFNAMGDWFLARKRTITNGEKIEHIAIEKYKPQTAFFNGLKNWFKVLKS